ncbi:MAG: helix-turn-helix domain-containing protein [Methanomassiliicoccales archaeon]|jgi:sugar-specific transcriptional regulator TrmB
MNLIDILNLDTVPLTEEYGKIAAALRKIGLSEYEAKAYIAMIARSHATADEVADLSQIPRTSAYKALQGLKDKGLVTVTDGRPAVFHALPVDEAREKVIDDVKEMFDKLRMLQGVLTEKGTPQLVYTIAGKKNVLAKIGQMIDSAVESFVISTPVMSEIRSEHAQRFKDAARRGVELVIIAEPMVKLPDHTKAYRKKDMLATDVIADGKTAMIASPDLSLCGYSDNPFIASHLESIIRQTIERLDESSQAQ